MYSSPYMHVVDLKLTKFKLKIIPCFHQMPFKLLMVCTSKHLSNIHLSKDIEVVEGITNIPFDNVSFQYLETFPPTHDNVCWPLVAMPNKNLDVTSFGTFHVSTYPIITMDYRGLELCIPLLLTLGKLSENTRWS